MKLFVHRLQPPLVHDVGPGKFFFFRVPTEYVGVKNVSINRLLTRNDDPSGAGGRADLLNMMIENRKAKDDVRIRIYVHAGVVTGAIQNSRRTIDPEIYRLYRI